MSVTDEIKERLDIVEVISGYVPLKKAGHTYKGLCPFHNEKTPSFVVFPDTQGWHCFGACSTGGDVFTFVMKRENLSFGETLELLAARAGVELPKREGGPSADEQHLERLREILADASGYFHYLLNRASEAKVARDYLEKRGLTDQTWESWQLGYSLDSWDALKDRLVGKGYSLEEIEEAGLVIQRDDSTGYYDRFRGRLMIPIRDVRGRTIGFGARLLRDDPERPQPKYINSPQTPLFDKGSVLYGLDVARQAIRDANLAVLVEGYMDVLMSHQVGVKNVVAGMGTALTEAQLGHVKRYSGNITLALDPDTAGDHATLRGLETARQTLEREWEPVFTPTGLVRLESRLKAELRIATLPEGLDPDELARQDVESWRRVIAGAQPIVDYYLAAVSREEDLTTAHGKDVAVTRMAPLLREIASPVERNHYIQLLARTIQVDERLVAQQVETLGRAADVQRRAKTQDEPDSKGGRATRSERTQQTTESPSSLSFGLEEHILGSLLARPDLLARLDVEAIEMQAAPLNQEDFSDTENRALLVALQSAIPVSDDWTPDALLASLPDTLKERCRKILERAQSAPALTDEKLTKDLGDSLLRLRARRISAQISQLEFLMMESQEAEEREQSREYQELMVSYTTQKRHVQKLLSSRTMTGALALGARPGTPTQTR